MDRAWVLPLFEFGFVSVFIGAILIWQLWDVNKAIAEDKKRAADERKNDPPAA